MASAAILGMQPLRPSFLDDLHVSARREACHPSASHARRHDPGAHGPGSGRLDAETVTPAFRFLLPPQDDEDVDEDESWDEDEEVEEDEEDGEDHDDEEVWQVLLTWQG